MPRKNISHLPVFPQYRGIETQLIYEHNNDEPDSREEEDRITIALRAIARLGLTTESSIAEAERRLKDFNLKLKGPRVRKQYNTTPQDINWLQVQVVAAKNSARTK